MSTHFLVEKKRLIKNYDMNDLWQTACMSVNQIMFDNLASRSLFHYMKKNWTNFTSVYF